MEAKLELALLEAGPRAQALQSAELPVKRAGLELAAADATVTRPGRLTAGVAISHEKIVGAGHGRDLARIRLSEAENDLALLKRGPDQAELLDAIPPIQGPRSWPRFRPGVFQGDRAYGWDENIRATRKRGVQPQLARPKDDTHGSGLGRTRWVVEGALSWFNNHRRLRVCYERSEESLLALHQLAAVLICAEKLDHRQAA